MTERPGPSQQSEPQEVTEKIPRRKLLKAAGIAGAGLVIGGAVIFESKHNNSATLSSPTLTPVPHPTEQVIDSNELKRLQLHNQFHYPVIEGKEVPATPYLTLPITSEVGKEWDITEGWFYSQEEQRIDGETQHSALDIQAPYGTAIAAPADGYAMSSYYTYSFTDQSGNPILYEGKQIGFGFGNFIEMYVPEVNRFIVLGHMSEVDKTIPFSKPVLYQGNGWYPTNHNLLISELKNSPYYVKVKQGQLLGRMGHSGLSWPYDPLYHGESEPPVFRNEKDVPSWDETHVHMEDFYRAQDPDINKRIKGWYRDPAAVYWTFEEYPSPKRPEKKFGKDPLFILPQGSTLPQFAR